MKSFATVWLGLAVALATKATTAANVTTANNSSTPIYKDPSYSAADRATDLLGRMTWAEKIGQMGGVRRLLGTDLSFNQTSYDIIAQDQNGILGFGENYNLASDVLPIANEVRQQQINSTDLGIPFVTVTDSLNSIYTTGGTLFPPSLSLGASFNIALYEQVIAAIRDENVAVGTRWVLSPELDLAIEPHGGRVGEMYSEDPYHVGAFGSAYIRTMQQRDADGYVKVACTAKHFVYGQSSGGINAASQYGGLNRILNEQAMPFWTVIADAKPLALMASYAAVDRVPMAANKYLLQTILRGLLGFDGVIMSDAGAISELHSLHLVANSSAAAARKALQAGLQLELAPGQPAMFPQLLASENDTAVAALVDEAVQRLLEIKFLTGTFDEPLPTLAGLNATLRKQAHLDIAKTAADESIVLLQNTNDILPLATNNSSSTTNIAVIGPLADLLVMGSYAPNNSTQPLHGTTFLQALRDSSSSSSTNITYLPGVDITNTTSPTNDIPGAAAAAASADLTILTLGSISVLAEDGAAVHRTDGEFFAHPSLHLPGAQEALLDAVLAATNTPTILVLTGGQAFALRNETLAQCGAIVHALLAGERTGEALVDVLWGRTNPSGKMPVTMPMGGSSGEAPVYYWYLPSDVGSGWDLPVTSRAEPIFKFGFGLSYTSFAIAAPVVVSSSSAGGGGGNVTVEVEVRNTGAREGKEVVQCYFRQAYTAVETPNKRLVRFEKVSLQPGEATTVQWSIAQSELGYWDGLEWVAEGGDVTFWVGSSSRAQDLQSVTVTL